MTTKIIAIANQKGGVGKTTTTASLGTALSRMGHQVLLIDSDPQGSLTASFGYNTDANSITLSTVMRQVITGEPVSDNAIIRHEFEKIDLIPADISLAGIESTLVNVSVDREYVLKDFLETVQGQYDYILIDCMPSLGMLTVNALVAAHSVLIPVQAAYLSAKGLEQLLATVGRIKKRLNPALQIDGMDEKMDLRETSEYYEELVKDNIEYDILLERDRTGQQYLDELVSIMVDALTSPKEALFVDGAHRPSDAVKTRLLSLDSSHIEFVQECLSENTTHVKNIKAYLLTCLWRAPETMNHRYMMLVNHHFNGGADGK